MQVFLHIGAHKTGTSTIQAALSAGGDFLYPATGRDGRRGHYPLAWSVVGRYRRRYSVPPASIWSDLDAELRESDREKAIISSEFFWRAEPDEAKRIRSYLHEHDLTAILYVRHPADYLVSYYKQEVKTGVCRKSFRDFVAEKLPLADFAAYADRWAGAMPTEVRLLERCGDVVADFSALCGVSLQKQPRTNVSPGDNLTRAMRYMNVLGGKNHPVLHPIRRRMLESKWKRALDRWPTASLRDQVLSEFGDEIRELCERLLRTCIPRQDWHYLQPD